MTSGTEHVPRTANSEVRVLSSEEHVVSASENQLRYLDETFINVTSSGRTAINATLGEPFGKRDKEKGNGKCRENVYSEVPCP